MKNLNYEFFEEFKHLDKLCKDIYKGEAYGVTKYINEMKEVSISRYQNIPNWKTDLNKLIQFRHIKNKMSHETGAFDEEKCTQDDINWLRNFYERIMQQSDPISLLHKNSQEKNKIHNQNYIDYPLEIEQESTTEDYKTILPVPSISSQNPVNIQMNNQIQQPQPIQPIQQQQPFEDFEDDEKLNRMEIIFAIVIILAAIAICSAIIIWGLKIY